MDHGVDDMSEAQLKHELFNALAKAQAVIQRLGGPESLAAYDALLQSVNKEIRYSA